RPRSSDRHRPHRHRDAQRQACLRPGHHGPPRHRLLRANLRFGCTTTVQNSLENKPQPGQVERRLVNRWIAATETAVSRPPTTWMGVRTWPSTIQAKAAPTTGSAVATTPTEPGSARRRADPWSRKGTDDPAAPPTIR